MMEVQLKIIGCLFVALAGVHVIFPRYFNWRSELASLSLINRQLMQVHTFFIAFVVFLMGVLCIFSAEDMVQTRLGKQVALGLFVFWFTRLIFQLFVYSPKLWRGKQVETVVHVLAILLWSYLSWVFFSVYYQ